MDDFCAFFIVGQVCFSVCSLEPPAGVRVSSTLGTIRDCIFNFNSTTSTIAWQHQVVVLQHIKPYCTHEDMQLL